MKNYDKWISVFLIILVFVWFFTAGLKNFVTANQTTPVHNGTQADIQGMALSRLTADSKSAKTRAEQEAEYTKKYYPNSQGDTTVRTPRAMDLATDPNKPVPKDNKQTSRPPKTLKQIEDEIEAEQMTNTSG